MDDNFHPIDFECSSCKETFRSSRPKEFVRCKCGESFVDQAIHYTRYGGKAKVRENKDEDSKKNID